MFNFWPIYKREVKTFFQSPGTYVVLALWFLFLGIVFFIGMREFSQASDQAGQPGMFGQVAPTPNVTHDLIQGIFQFMTAYIMFTVPLLSMRLVAEEKNSGTFELLVTCPIGDWSILLGKYFSLLTVGVVNILISAAFPLLVWFFGRRDGAAPEWPVVIACWTGLMLIYAAYAAFGLMASAFTENQIIAAVITLIGIILWNALGSIPWGGMTTVASIMAEASAARHTDNFIKGVLMLKDFVFYGLSAFLFLFIASKTLDARRWRV